ncbi:MAG TPA: iron-containing redox enzyme family protein [Burkholderiaceae bacterium]
MDDHTFTLTGALTDLHSYPQWAIDMVEACAPAKRRLVGHELFARMRDAALAPAATANFLVGSWPVIEQFPKYMALNICKTVHGRSRGDDMARRFLMRNIRIEQHHAEMWLNWAGACGISRNDVFNSELACETRALPNWCLASAGNDTLAASMAATNYAIEGAAGEWTVLVCASDAYEQSFTESAREHGIGWLKAHAHYDDTHPWEALEIVCTLMGTKPAARDVAHLRQCVTHSYDYMTMMMDRALQAP